ncbi:hypothetical protein [Parvibaculum sp.]|uniref:hypothetical protein n=1 Tax=Alphaproteobacteria TaxID=28211 RepID=UPI001B234E1B|nr:hypothetical protein [Parvibaculum sp.]MBO6669797.1 hypothetical protein [Parvibaculum sp.]MBO6691372.1 hypothetical protein [Parvibaculum sp.]MBO6715316.1 hypothetical protein [Parvibaculum sp.]
MAGEIVDDDTFQDRLARVVRGVLPVVAHHAAAAEARDDQRMEPGSLEQQPRCEVSHIRIAFSSEHAKEAR